MRQDERVLTDKKSRPWTHSPPLHRLFRFSSALIFWRKTVIGRGSWGEVVPFLFNCVICFQRTLSWQSAGLLWKNRTTEQLQWINRSDTRNKNFSGLRITKNQINTFITFSQWEMRDKQYKCGTGGSYELHEAIEPVEREREAWQHSG